MERVAGVGLGIGASGSLASSGGVAAWLKSARERTAKAAMTAMERDSDFMMRLRIEAGRMEEDSRPGDAQQLYHRCTIRGRRISVFTISSRLRRWAAAGWDRLSIWHEAQVLAGDE